MTRPFRDEYRRTRKLRTVPTVLRSRPYRVYFVSHDIDEPAHVHVDRDDQSVKFWSAPVALARNLGFTAVELGRVQGLVSVHEPRLLEAWHEYIDEDLSTEGLLRGAPAPRGSAAIGRSC